MKVRRRAYRHEIRLRAWLAVGGDWVVGETADASRFGLLLLVARSPAVGQAVRFKVELVDGRMLELRGIVRRVLPGQGRLRPGGAGIELTGNHPAVLAQWEEFVVGLGVRSRAALATSTGIHLGERSESLQGEVIRRRIEAARGAAEAARGRTEVRQLTLAPSTVEQLASLGDCARRGGRLYLSTSSKFADDERVILIVVHPETDAEMALSGTVTTSVQGDDGVRAGIRVLMDRVPTHLRAALDRFIGGEFHGEPADSPLLS